jgi:hypothetical protein
MVCCLDVHVTIFAAIIPYAAGHLGLVVAERTDSGLTVIAEESIEVGRLVALERPEAGRDKRREVADDDLWRLANQVGGMIVGLGVDEVLVENPGPNAALAWRVHRAFASVSLVGVLHRIIPESWRCSLGSGVGARRQKAREHCSRFGFAGAYDSTLFAAALLVEQVFPLHAITLPKPPSDPEIDRQIAEATGPRNKRPAQNNWAPGFGPPDVAPEVIRDIATLIAGPVTAGIDPGSRSLALAIAVGDAAPLSLVHKSTHEVGETVPLLHPKKIRLVDGTERITTTRRELTPEAVDRLADELVETMTSYGVERLVLEHVDSVHIDPDNLRAASSIATNLVRSTWVGTEISVRARHVGIEVVRVRPATWRARVAGRGSKNAETELIPNAVRAGFFGWPDDANEHERDAGGLCLYGRLPEGKPKSAPRKRAAGYRQSSEGSNHARASRRAQERRDAGCTCGGKRHRGGCKLAKKG